MKSSLWLIVVILALGLMLRVTGCPGGCDGQIWKQIQENREQRQEQRKQNREDREDRREQFREDRDERRRWQKDRRRHGPFLN